MLMSITSLITCPFLIHTFFQSIVYFLMKEVVLGTQKHSHNNDDCGSLAMFQRDPGGVDRSVEKEVVL